MNEFYIQMQGWFGGLFDPLIKVIQSLLILVCAWIVTRVGHKVIRGIVEKQRAFKYSMNTKRLDTMATLLNSVLKYSVYFIAAITILTKTLGIFDLQAVIVPAGIGGVIVGFGAQSLVKDVLSGFFILLENQFAVGDMITIEGMTGTVEEIELRITRIRNFNGDLYLIPNGEIKKVTNHTRGHKGAIVDIPVDYKADTRLVIETAREICENIKNDFDTIIEGPDVLGFVEFRRDHAILRIFAKTKPNTQWELEREIRKRIKDEFNRRGIEFPALDFLAKGDRDNKM